MFFLQTLIQKFTHLTRNYTLRVPKVDVFAVFQIPAPQFSPCPGPGCWGEPVGPGLHCQ